MTTQTLSLSLSFPSRQTIGRAVLVGAILLMCISGFGFRWILGQRWAVPENGIIFMFLGRLR